MFKKIARVCSIAMKIVKDAKDKDVSNLLANICIGVGVIGLLIKLDGKDKKTLRSWGGLKHESLYFGKQQP